MLRELNVTDFAIIGETRIEFGPGLNILTGETGAGKSILIDALEVALGGRASEEMIRSGAASAAIEAVFGLEDAPRAAAWLAENGFAPEEGELLVRRTLTRGGKGRAFLNGAMATIGQMRAAGAMLVDLHGQHESQSLLDPRAHRALYDRFLGLDGEREAYREAYDAWQAARKRLDAAESGQKEMERRIDLLRHQSAEIAAAELIPGEDEQLAAEKARLANAEKLLELAGRALEALDDRDASAMTLAAQARAGVESIASLDPTAAALAETANAALIQLEEAAAALRAYADGIEADPARLEVVDDRLALIKSLKKKYGDSIGEIQRFHEQAAAELATLEFDRDHLEDLRRQAAETGAKAAARALALDKKRRAGSAKFSRAVGAQLAELALEKAAVEAVISYEDDPASPCALDGRAVRMGPEGVGAVELMFSANPGEPVKPLAKIASGGEISRLMLALKSVITGAQPAPVMIFDEIDTGVGGVTADRLGAKMAALARESQVFCVTHLAQVARWASLHFCVSKSEVNGRVNVTVERLGEKEKIAELARMAGGAAGDEADKAARKWAKEALASVKRG